MITITRREQLLPKWVRFCSWIFLLFLATPIVFLVSIYIGNMPYGLFGVSYQGSPLHPLPIAMVVVMTLHGITAYGLLTGKRWGLDTGILCAVIGMTFSIAGMAMASWAHFEFSVIAQVVFLSVLLRFRKQWLTI